MYTSTCLAGAILEIVAHRGRLKLPGRYHAGRVTIPEDVACEVVTPTDIPGWDLLPDAPAARAFGDRWLSESRTAVLVVPAFTARPLQQNLLLNPAHPEYARCSFEPPLSITWDVRLLATG